MTVLTYFGHLHSLRKHLWVSALVVLAGFAICMFFFDELIVALTDPLDMAAGQTGGELYLTTVYEGFLARIRISLIAGLVLTLPAHICNLLVFIFPALKPREKRIASVLVSIGFVLVVMSVYYGYRFLIPFSIQFLTDSAFIADGASFLLGFTKNIFYIVQLFTALIVIFQMPLLMILLIGLKLITVSSAFKGGRYVVVAAFILSAILTPPDIVSQVMTALPLILLYFLGLLAAWLFRLGDR